MLVWRRHLILRLQVLAWSIAVAFIAWRFGTEAQLGFYSNDQLQYASVVRILQRWNWGEGESATLFWWLDFAKIPFTLTALPLTLTGINVALALKTTSLVCLLAISNEILDRYPRRDLGRQFQLLYITGTGIVGGFFSVLALRDTMMMYFVFRFATNRSVTGRLISIAVIFLLRSHLAIALITAEIVMTAWKWGTNRSRLGYIEVPLLMAGGLGIGIGLFYLRFGALQSAGYGLNETKEIASNFVGLQFLVQNERFVKLSVSELLLLRVLFSDTIAIPIAFTTASLFFPTKLNYRSKFILVAFCIYLGIVTNTDFNSFRQNIPFMPLMGLAVLDIIQIQKLRSSSRGREVALELEERQEDDNQRKFPSR